MASRVVNQIKDHGVLIKSDGPHHNVLKIKPPIMFSMADVEVLVETLGSVLAEAPK